MPRRKPSDLLVLVAVCGLAFAGYRLFWLPPPSLNHRFFPSTFLACLSLASPGSFFARPRWRRGFRSFLAFAWLVMIFVV
jgi:hypothetical protein